MALESFALLPVKARVTGRGQVPRGHVFEIEHHRATVAHIGQIIQGVPSLAPIGLACFDQYAIDALGVQGHKDHLLFQLGPAARGHGLTCDLGNQANRVGFGTLSGTLAKPNSDQVDLPFETDGHAHVTPVVRDRLVAGTGGQGAVAIGAFPFSALSVAEAAGGLFKERTLLLALHDHVPTLDASVEERTGIHTKTMVQGVEIQHGGLVDLAGSHGFARGGQGTGSVFPLGPGGQNGEGKDG